MDTLRRYMQHVEVNFPAIDVLKSVSRCMSDVIQKEHKGYQGKVLKAMALYRENEDLIQLGAYAKGTNPQLDQAIALHDELDAFLIQGIDEKSDYEASVKKLSELAQKLPST